MMLIQNKFEIEQIVYLVTDDDQRKRIVTSIKVCKNGELVYEVNCGAATSYHYEFEISAEENIVLKST